MRHPASARRRHHLRLRRADHAGQHPRLPGAVGAAHPRLGGAVPRRTPAADRARPDKPDQALFGVVQGAQYEDLRREAARGLVGHRRRRRPRLRRLRHRRRAGEAEPGDHRRLGHRRAARRQAAAPAGHQRTRRPVRRRRGGRRHVRLRVAVAGRPQRRGVLGDRSLQHHRRPLPPRLHADRRRCDCYTCAHYTRAYLHHLFKAQGDPGRRRCARSTTSASSSGWSTRSATPSIRRRVEFDELREHVWAATTATRSDLQARCVLTRAQ